MSSLIETEDEDEPGLDEAVRNKKEPEEAIKIIKRYEEISKTQNRKIINIVGKQEQLLKKFKETEGFWVSPIRPFNLIFACTSVWLNAQS